MIEDVYNQVEEYLFMLREDNKIILLVKGIYFCLQKKLKTQFCLQVVLLRRNLKTF